MAELIIQYKNKEGDRLYPVTLATAVVDNNGTDIETKLSQVIQNLNELTLKVDNNKSNLNYLEQSLMLTEKSVDILEDSIQSMIIKIDAYDERIKVVERSNDTILLKIEEFEATLEKIQPEIIIQALTKVEENSEAIQILVSDATVEGSVDNKIATAFDWAEIQ